MISYTQRHTMWESLSSHVDISSLYPAWTFIDYWTLFQGDCSMIMLVTLDKVGLCSDKKTYWYSCHESRFQHAGIPFTALLYLGGL